MRLLLEADGPFDCGHTWRYWGRVPGEIVDVLEGECYVRVLRIGERDVLVRVRPLDRSRQRLEATCDSLTSGEREVLEGKLRRIFNLDLDLEGFYAFAEGDGLLSEAVKALYGYRPPCFPSLFEGLVCTIIGQQVNVRFNLDVKRRLVKQYGRVLSLGGREYYGFPSPADLASVSGEALRALLISRQKAGYITGVAKLFVEGKLGGEKVRRLGDEEALNCLMDVRGVGRWTAEYVMIRGLGRTSAIPAVDTGMRAAFTHFFKLEKAKEGDVRRLSEKWGKWKGLAGFYLRSAYYLKTDR